MASEFINKVVIVTGSTSGIGEAISIMFASRGAKVTICGRDTERLKRVFDQAVTFSGGHAENVLTVDGDINDHQVRKLIVDRTVEKFGRLDVLVANAGTMSPNMSIMNTTEESFNAVMDTNLKAVFFLIKEVVPHLEKTKGNIVNISSICSELTFPYMTTYCMSKAAVDHLTRCFSAELGRKGIRVNSVNPGYIGTRLIRNLKGTVENYNDFANSEKSKQFLCGRVGTVEDVAEVVVFLASDRAGFFTAEHIKVDGGRRLNGSPDESKMA